MNLLIIGNGFDLAHNLPTTYPDFLKFFKIIKITSTWNGNINDFKDKHLDSYSAPDYVKAYVENAFMDRQPNPNKSASNANPLIQEIYDNLTDNIWYDYLMDIFSNGKMKGIHWIDFESEISYIVEQIDRFQENMYTPFTITATANEEKLKKFLSKIKFDTLLTNKNKPDNYKPTYRDFLDKSYLDLRRLVRCMEIYLLECVETPRPIDLISQDIKQTNVNAVLCFNYTHTFERLYMKNDKIKIHYLHGEIKVDDNINANNMVLGIDEYYDADEKNKHTNYNIYKKFTQRVLNDTGFLYRNWISEMDNIAYKLKRCPSREDTSENLPNNIYIFGHSLDITDKDVIKDLIARPDVKTTIFYHDKQQQVQQIANLIKMLDQDKFIDMVNSVPQKICFVHQQQMKTKD